MDRCVASLPLKLFFCLSQCVKNYITHLHDVTCHEIKNHQTCFVVVIELRTEISRFCFQMVSCALYQHHEPLHESV